MKVIVPASTSNLGPGFDTLGLAVNRHLVIETEPAPRLSIEVTGEGASHIPADESNLTVRAIRRVLNELPDLRIKIQNGIPECGGFGASGAAIVGGLLIGNGLSEKKLTAEEIYNMAVQMEGHPDNVSAALLGGLVVNARGSDGIYSHIKFPVDRRLKFVAILPDSRVETGSARKMLPMYVPLAEAVSNVQHSSLLVAALASGNYDMIRYATHDELHEKHRKKLIPHFAEFDKTAAENGALAFTISGAGSSCIAFCLDDCSKVYDAFSALVSRLGLNWRTEILEPVNEGAELIDQRSVEGLSERKTLNPKP
ncbi:MAG: homoserine kinase [Bacteroidetes bacterium]|nr:homoserine kinase [Bacteroidota bacterium]